MKPKYVLIKAEEWGDYIDYVSSHYDGCFERAIGLPIPKGFFAMVEGDVFAPAGALAYAANILTLLDYDEAVPFGYGLTEEQRETLHTLADDLSALAVKWQTGSMKVPD